ncbi:unnamed protein product [Adineta ricciae]|uniref:Uncharacterized protein n=1 Tax=Adineta ricciae TaxID=249248 RepID=A0A814WZP1_ADIRI|nr:unnamed protein product [Adineta ricciae]CAF1577366.1 unnamed protein product [Adineta ricciae]
MIKIVLFLATAAGLIHAQTVLYQCSIWGDPQLVQFPTNNLQSAQHSFCSFDGHAMLYQSKYVLVSVRSARQGDLVLDFNIVFFNNASVPICTVNVLDFITGERICDTEIVIKKTGSTDINVQYKQAQFSVWIQRRPGNHYKITLFTAPAHINDGLTSGMCVQGCRSRSIQSLAMERTANMTDTQIVTSALATKVCDLFISQSVNNFLRTTRSSPGFVEAVRQGCISDVTLTGDSRLAGEGIENIFADAIIQQGTVSIENISQLTTNISSVATQVVQQAEVETEKLVTSATWPCQPDVPVCIMPSLIRRRLISVFG